MSAFSQIPADRYVGSNALAFAVEDSYPVSPGHTLVIPRREFATWWEATPDERQAMLDLVDTVRNQLLSRTPTPDGPLPLYVRPPDVTMPERTVTP